ncbi:cytochrome P450 [Kibdelosporangium phytohabitans]|uniref:cytochrome P450 n=1 Tax=Kibdelosporangium phytohabitans TaxID=860235 RepID=UPI001A06CBAD|nr:cytochrome P450 [Kibdelosporangium phytohabitans]
MTTTHVPGATRFDEWLLNKSWRSSELTNVPNGSGLKAVPGDGGIPLVGHSLEALRLGLDFGLKRYETYGPVSWMNAFGVRMVMVTGGDATQVVMTNKDKVFSQKGWEYFIGPFFRRGLMLLDFDEHMFHRRLMQQAFTRQRLTGYLGHVASAAAGGVKSWQPGKLLMYPALKQLTLDIAGSVFMAAALGKEKDALNKAFVDTVRAGTSLIRFPVPGGRWNAGLRGRQVLEDFFRRTIPAKRASDSDDLFAGLCHARTDDGSAFSDDDVVNHMIFLMMAAHDTTTITTTTATYYLAKHPEWQDRVREECVKAGPGPLDIDALEGLTNLEMVIKESLRLVAPVPSLARRTVRDTEILGHYVPANTMVSLTPWVTQMLPELWPNPARFDPERFSSERKEDKVHRYAWLPFGGGAHKCIGLHFGMLEVKTLLHQLLTHHQWSVPEDYEVRWDTTALPAPSDGLPIALKR